MLVRFFGTRGSLPVPGPRTVRYGGNTSCVAVRAASGTLVVLDMGTGAYALGQELAASGQAVRGHILITHTHWDHIQGLPFFAPFFRPDNEWDVYAPRGVGSSLRETLSGQMQYKYFPLELEQFGATIRYHDLVEGSLALDDVTLETHYLNHPALTLGYRLAADEVTVVYALDHEPFAPALASGMGPIEGRDQGHLKFIAGADLVIHDAQYLAEEYHAKRGWGHSTVEYAAHVCRSSGVRRLALAHHDPQRTDEALDALAPRLHAFADLEVFAAAEGMTIELKPVEQTRSEARPVSRTAASAQPALARQSALLVGEDVVGLKRLADILRGDGVQVVTCGFEEAGAAVKRARPALLVIVNPDSPEVVKTAVNDVRQLVGASWDLPIVLIDESEGVSVDKLIGIDDWLIAPFSASYARTRLRAWLMRRACQWAQPRRGKDEDQRLAALRGLNILDTPADERLDHLVQEAVSIFDVPIAAVTLVDRDRQWFKASSGLADRETHRDESFCAHVVADPVPLTVPDTLLDSRFAENPGVTGDPHVRFYAGYPLFVTGGHCVGSFCIADTRPRHLDAQGASDLARLASVASAIVDPSLVTGSGPT